MIKSILADLKKDPMYGFTAMLFGNHTDEEWIAYNENVRLKSLALSNSLREAEKR